MKKKISLFIVMCITILLTQTAYASESESVPSSELFEINQENQERIAQAISRDVANEQYISEVIRLFEKDIHSNSEELNNMLSEVIDELEMFDEASENKMQQAINEQNELIQNTPQTRGDWTDSYYGYLAGYMSGIQIVRSAGCPRTADYMEHAIVPVDKVHSTWTPSAKYHNNDSWATFLCTSTELYYEVFERFEQEILPSNTNYGVLTGSHAFTTSGASLDAYVGLHNVSYIVTFTKKSNGYSVTYKLSDEYDFEWNRYNNIAVGFGNNYCAVMQSCGYIRPFPITITYTS